MLTVTDFRACATSPCQHQGQKLTKKQNTEMEINNGAKYKDQKLL